MSTDGTLQRLLQWFSAGFPVGAFSFSHGLEWAVEERLVNDRASLEAWLADILRHGGGWSDAVLLAHAHRAANHPLSLAEISELASALPATSELSLETTVQGDAFARTTGAVWPEPVAELPTDPPMPVAVGCLAALHGIPLALVLTAYLHGFVANLVSAGVRLIPLGQTDGQRVLAALSPVIDEIAAAAPAVALEDLGTATLTVDWCSMRHETQHTRLFRS